jgi:GTP cyclohydrolase I
MSSTETNKYKIDWNMFRILCYHLANKIQTKNIVYNYIYPIPKNGMYLAERLSHILEVDILYDEKELLTKKNVLIIDDLIDSGRTLSKYKKYDKAVLFVKNDNEDKVTYYIEKTNKWIMFPWEKESDVEDIVTRQLEYIGENPNREGLKNTPERVVKSWKELYSGYNINPKNIMTVFEEGTCNEMIVLKDINFFSTCEHHLQPFFGKIYIGYVPDGKVLGVSKFARLVEIFARRLQIQENMTAQIADCIMKYLQPKGVMIVVEAKHLCMISRGIKSQDAKMTTSAIRGVFEKIEVRNEFLNLIRR